MTDKNNNNALFFLSGAILGAAAAYYFQSPAGKRLRTELAVKTGEIKSTITEVSSDIATQANEKVNAIVAKTGEALESAKHKINQVSNQVVEEAEEQIDGFEAGMEKARRNLDTNPTK